MAGTPGQVTASMPARILMDQGRAQFTAQVRDRQFQPAADAHVTAHVMGPDGVNAFLDLTPSQQSPGTYQADWTAEKPGAYLAEITADSAGGDRRELGRDVVTFEREDGVAESFHTEQNRALLEQLAAQTGGRYWKPGDLKDLPRDISYSEAGISVRTTKELWNMPIVFALLVGLPASRMAAAAKVGRGMKRAALMLFVLCLCALHAFQARAATYYVIVAGLGGEPDYEQRFTGAAKDLDKVFKESSESAHVVTLTGGQATAAQLRATLGTVASEAKAEDDFVLILIGHGSFDGVEYKFNLVGPDVTGAEIAQMCDRIAARRQLVVNTTSASGGSVAALERPGRAVIAATKSGTEKNATVFARYWVEALAGSCCRYRQERFGERHGGLRVCSEEDGRVL